MPFCEVLKLQMPDTFPLVEYEGYVAAVRSNVEPESDARKEFNGASNLIGWRYRACTEHKEQYLRSWRRYGSNVSFEELYEREKNFFGMFVCGISCIESACYACYAVASYPKLLNLPFDENIRRKNAPRHLYSKLSQVLPGHTLTNVLKAGLNSEEWGVLTSYRNTMTHRSNIPRIIFGAVGSAPPPEKIMQFAETWSTKAMGANEKEFEGLFMWINEFLRNVLRGGTELFSVA